MGGANDDFEDTIPPCLFSFAHFTVVFLVLLLLEREWEKNIEHGDVVVGERVGKKY